MKLCLTRFIYNYNLNIEAELTALARQREATYYGEKEKADTDVEFFSWFSVVYLTCLFAGSRPV